MSFQGFGADLSNYSPINQMTWRIDIILPVCKALSLEIFSGATHPGFLRIHECVALPLAARESHPDPII